MGLQPARGRPGGARRQKGQLLSAPSHAALPTSAATRPSSPRPACHPLSDRLRLAPFARFGGGPRQAVGPSVIIRLRGDWACSVCDNIARETQYMGLQLFIHETAMTSGSFGCNPGLDPVLGLPCACLFASLCRCNAPYQKCCRSFHCQTFVLHISWWQKMLFSLMIAIQ